MNYRDLETAFVSTRSILVNVTADQYALPTPCQTWDVRGLINHFVEGCHWAAATARSGEGPAQIVDPPDVTESDPLAAYDEGIAAALAAFSDPAVLDKTITLEYLSFPGTVLIELVAEDQFVHGWDLARATSQSSDLNPQLARDMLAGAKHRVTDELRGADGTALFGPIVEVPDTAPAVDQLAGFLGRKP